MTQCSEQIPDIVKGYNHYFQSILWSPQPNGALNWFDGANQAIRTSFAAYPAIIAALPPLGQPPKPPAMNGTTIKNAKQLGEALTATLKDLPAWIGTMTDVAEMINRQTSPCSNTYGAGLSMLLELKGRLTAFAPPNTTKPKDVCDAALDWIRTFYYWQSTLTVWEQGVFDHCVDKTQSSPAPAMRIEIPLGGAQPIVTVVQFPADSRAIPIPLKADQIPPPIWPPWN